MAEWLDTDGMFVLDSFSASTPPAAFLPTEQVLTNIEQAETEDTAVRNARIRHEVLDCAAEAQFGPTMQRKKDFQDLNDYI